MTDRLIIGSGDTYTVDSGDTEEWSGADVDGTLQVDGTLKLTDNPEVPGSGAFTRGGDPLDLPLGSINFATMQLGLSVFLIGILALLSGLSAILQNWFAMAVVGLSIVALILSGVVGIGLETFWVLIIAASLLVIVGVVVRWL